jgi:hypothetical protein
MATAPRFDAHGNEVLREAPDAPWPWLYTEVEGVRLRVLADTLWHERPVVVVLDGEGEPLGPPTDKTARAAVDALREAELAERRAEEDAARVELAIALLKEVGRLVPEGERWVLA